MAEGPQALKKDPLSEIAAPRGGLFFWCCPMTYLFPHPSSLLYALPRKSQAPHRKFTDRKGLPSVAGHYILRYIELPAVSAEWPDTPVAPPLGELAPKVTERARTLPENHKHSDSIALTKANAYRCATALGRRACPLRHCFAMPPLPRGEAFASRKAQGSPLWGSCHRR